MENLILEKLKKIEELLKEQTLLKKEVLTLHEAAEYINVSISHMYKLTSDSRIPHYKPNGKMLYFNRKKLDERLLSNRNTTKDEIESIASNYLIQKGKVKF